MTIELSRRLAILLGIFTPGAEIITRLYQWHHLGFEQGWHFLTRLNVWPFWINDFIIGWFLLSAAWICKKDIEAGRRMLAGAWGLTLGMIYTSFFAQLSVLARPSVAPVSSVSTAVIKGIGVAASLAGLFAALRPALKGVATQSAATQAGAGLPLH